MVIVRLTFIFFCYVSIINSTKSNADEKYASHIFAVVKYLNSNPNKVYDYNKGLFINAQLKADTVELTIEVSATCIPNYMEVPCTEQHLICSGFLQQNVDGHGFKILSNVACKPKRDFSIESLVELSSTATPLQQESEIVLSHEAVSPEENANFVAVKVDAAPCVGCPFDLNTNAEGVYTLVNTTLRHIETERSTKHRLIKIIKLQQQVVAGIKYILLIEIAPTVCQKDTTYSNCSLDSDVGSFFCEVIFFQKPWISKSKLIIKNNCTLSQEYNNSEEISSNTSGTDNRNNTVDIQHITENSNIKYVDPNRLADLESQILDMKPENKVTTIDPDFENQQIFANIAYEGERYPFKDVLSNSYKIQEPVTFYNNYKPFFNFFFNQYQYEKESLPVRVKPLNKNAFNVSHLDQPHVFLSNQGKTNFSNYTTNKNRLEGNSFVSSVIDYQKNASHGLFLEEISAENKQSFLKDMLHSENKVESITSDSSKRKAKAHGSLEEYILPTLKSNSSENSEENKMSINNRGPNGDDSNSSSRSSKMQNSFPEQIIRFKRNSNENNSNSPTSNKSDSRIREESKKEDDINKYDNNSKIEIHGQNQKYCANDSKGSSYRSNSVAVENNKIVQSIGQLKKITQDENVLVKHLADFAASSLDRNNYFNHKRIILQIFKAKKSKLDGISYQIILRLGISQCLENEEHEDCRKKLLTNLTKICKVQVHTEDDSSNPKVIKWQCQNIKKYKQDQNKINFSRFRREVLVGESSEISYDDPRIIEFTSDTLKELDSKSNLPNRHKIVNIVLATSQVVSGTKYHIKAKISLSDCVRNGSELLENCKFLENSKVELCDIVVWDQPWLRKRQTAVICGDKEYRFEYSPIRNKKSTDEDSISSFDKKSIIRKKNMVQGRIEEDSLNQLYALGYLKSILNHLDMESRHNNKLKVEEILAVNKQAVTGQLWRIKAEVTLSECLKTDLIDPQKCKKLQESDSSICVFKIWDRPWLPIFREVETNCGNKSQFHNFRLKRNVGVSKYVIPGSSDVGTKDGITSVKILEYVKIGLHYIDLKSVYETKYIVKNIKEVLKQEGVNRFWQITVEIVLSDCLKNYYTQHCEELENCETKTCNFKVWEQSRLSNDLQISISCKNDTNVYLFETQDIDNFRSKEIVNKFKKFMLEHNKTYLNKLEFNHRLNIFKNNLNNIKLLNKYEQGTGKYGITKFTDLTSSEFSKSHGLRMDLHNENDIPLMIAPIPDITLPVEFDWRKKGVVTQVKNQGSCGSCWAFSTTGNIEGQYAIKHGKLVEFSEQELVDCDKLDEGCNGGLMDNAYRTIEKMGGLETESDYPYDGEDEKCHFDKAKVQVQVTGALNISHNETDMAKWLVQNGPIAIAINANAMQFYVGGVSHPWKMLCNPKNLDHGVLIVGFGIHKYPLFNKTMPYWTIKNSWGSSWGEQGYYRVYRGDGTCGLNQTPSSATVA